jgi:hypothetical protein
MLARGPQGPGEGFELPQVAVVLRIDAWIYELQDRPHPPRGDAHIVEVVRVQPPILPGCELEQSGDAPLKGAVQQD